MTCQPTLFDATLAERWAVYRRARGGGWTLVARAGAEDAARRIMIRLMGDPKYGGHADWRVAPAGVRP